MELVVKIQDEEQEQSSFFPAECESCGWIGSSGNADGGGQIGDTGDRDDIRCPACGSLKIDECENEKNITQLYELLQKSSAMVKKMREKNESCDCEKHIYSHYEEENKMLRGKIEELQKEKK